MQEKLDNKLKKQFLEAFENFEADDALMNLGWKKLEKKLPAKSDRKLPVFWLSIAASIIFIFGIGITSYMYLPDTNLQRNTLVIRDNKKAPIKPNNHIDTDQKIEQRENLASANKNDINHHAGQENKTRIHITEQRNHILKKESEISTTAIVSIRRKKNISPIESTMNKEQGYPVQSNTDQNRSITDNRKAVPAENDLFPQYTAQQLDSINFYTKGANVWANINDENIIIENPELANIIASHIPDEQEGNSILKKKRPFKPSASIFINVNGYTNLIKGNYENAFNLGGGLGFSFTVHKKVSINAEANFVQYQLGYKGNFRAQSFVFTKNLNEAVAQNGAAITVADFNADVTSIHLPLIAHIKVVKSKFPVALNLGFNSIFYLKEEYTYNIIEKRLPQSFITQRSTTNYITSVDNTGNTLNAGVGITSLSQDNMTLKFRKFEPFSSLMLGVSVGVPTGKNNIIKIEPFLQIPLARFGAEQRSFNTFGLTLKQDLLKLGK